MAAKRYCANCDTEVSIDQPGGAPVCPKCGGVLTEPPIPVTPESHPQPTEMSGREAYNIATDLGTGPNVRLKDNLYQGVAIFVCTLLGAMIGLLVVQERLAGAIFGGFLGLLVGLLGSGFFLMNFRLIMHARGKHK